MSAVVETLTRLDATFNGSPEPEEEQPLNFKAVSLADQAKGIKVTDQVTHDQAAEMLIALAAMKKQIVEHHRDSKQKAHEAHAAICRAERSLLDPVEEAIKILAPAIGDWEAEQKRLEAEAARQAQEQAELAAAEELEREAVFLELQDASPAEIAAVLSAPLVVPQVKPVQTFQRTRGITTPTTWKAQITNFRELCGAIASGKHPHELIIGIDQKKGETHYSSPALNKMATALKQSMNIPGVKAVPVTGVRVGGR